MIRLLPRTLFGRMVLILVAGLVVAQLLATAIFLQERDRVGFRVLSRYSGTRIADIVKVFPGRVATPGYFSDIKGPLPHIPLMPTGNVELETAPAYFKAGAIAVGVGKPLIDPGHLDDGNLDAVRADIARWRRLVDGLAAPE